MSTLPYLPYKLTGNASSPYLLIFLHGFPDTFELWDPLITLLSKDFQCLNISYPNFASLKTEAKWGYDFPELIEAMKRTIDKVDLTPNESQTIVWKDKIFVSHDWGCYLSYFFDQQYPGFIKGMVALDIAAYFNVNFPIFLYQVILALAFLIGGSFGNFLTRRFLKQNNYRSPWEKYINTSLNYPYYYLWRNIFRSKLGLENQYLKNYKPSFPVTFIYAKDKPYQFHNKTWLQWLDKNQGSHQGVTGGHWFIKKQQQLLVEKVKERVKQIRSSL